MRNGCLIIFAKFQHDPLGGSAAISENRGQGIPPPHTHTLARSFYSYVETFIFIILFNFILLKLFCVLNFERYRFMTKFERLN